MNITFDDNLITGNKTIDFQHQELIDRIRQFVAACESGDSKIKAIKMLDYLDEYTNFHFQEEEELQKKVSYPEISSHHAKHEEFKTSIQELYDYLNENEGPDDQFIEQVKRNVVDWLFQHIKTFDRSVAEYIHLHDNSERL
jgi:hemerythrin